VSGQWHGARFSVDVADGLATNFVLLCGVYICAENNHCGWVCWWGGIGSKRPKGNREKGHYDFASGHVVWRGRRGEEGVSIMKGGGSLIGTKIERKNFK